MNKTFLRALPVFAIFSLIVIGVFIVSHTNGNKQYPMVEDTETVIYNTKEGDVKVTKGEIYNFLRYNNSINSEIDELIINEVLKNSTDTNYFDAVRADEDFNTEVENSIITSIFGIDPTSDNPYTSVQMHQLQLAAQKYIDNYYLDSGYEIDFDIEKNTSNKGDFVKELSEKAFKIEAIYETSALSQAKELFAKDILDAEVKDDGFNREDSPVYIESDELDNLVEELYENQKNATSYAYGIVISFDNLGDLKTASEAVVSKYNLSIGLSDDTASYTFASNNAELTDDELKIDANQVDIFKLYTHLYDYLYQETRHATDISNGNKFSLNELFFSNGKTYTSLSAIDFEGTVAAEEFLWYTETTYISSLSGEYPDNAPDAIRNKFDLEDDESIFNYLFTSNSSDSLANYIFSDTSSLGVVNSTERDSLPFTTVPKTYSSKKHIVTLFDVEEAKDFEDISDATLNVFKELAKENYISDALSAAYIEEEFSSAISELDITIYDELIGKTFSGSNPSYNINIEESSKYILEIGEKTYTPDEFYDILLTTSSFSSSITSLSKEKFILNFADGALYNSYFGDSKEDLTNDATNIKLSFGLGQATCSEYAEGYSWTEYLNLCYHVETEEELLDKLAVDYISHDFNMINFAQDKFNSDNSDIEDYDKYGKNLSFININQDLITDMENSVADYTMFSGHYNSVTANHLLVSLSKSDGSGFAIPTLDNVAGDWSETQERAAVIILENFVAFEQDENGTYLEALEALFEKYDDASYGSSKVFDLTDLEAIALDKNDYEDNYEDAYGYIKRLGLELKVEELNSFGTDQMVPPFEDRIKELFEIDEFKQKVLTDDNDESGYLDDKAVATEFGYHLINITDATKAPSSTLTKEELEDFNEDVGFLPEYHLEDDLLQDEDSSTDSAPVVPSEAQLKHYLKQVQSEDLTIRLPENVLEAINYYYTPIENERLSSNMLDVYFIEYFMMADSDTFNQEIKDILSKKIDIIEAQNSEYRELNTKLRATTV